MKSVVVQAIPYKTFKERLRIVKEHSGEKTKIEVNKTYIYIERVEE